MLEISNYISEKLFDVDSDEFGPQAGEQIGDNGRLITWDNKLALIEPINKHEDTFIPALDLWFLRRAKTIDIPNGVTITGENKKEILFNSTNIRTNFEIKIKSKDLTMNNFSCKCMDFFASGEKLTLEKCHIKASGQINLINDVEFNNVSLSAPQIVLQTPPKYIEEKTKKIILDSIKSFEKIYDTNLFKDEGLSMFPGKELGIFISDKKNQELLVIFEKGRRVDNKEYTQVEGTPWVFSVMINSNVIFQPEIKKYLE